MGILKARETAREIDKLKYGFCGTVSVADIVKSITSMPDAKRFLNKDKFELVYKQYMDYMSDTNKQFLTSETFLNKIIEIIRVFDRIAPFEDYCGGSVSEYSRFLEILREDDKQKQSFVESLKNDTMESEYKDIIEQISQQANGMLDKTEVIGLIKIHELFLDSKNKQALLLCEQQIEDIMKQNDQHNAQMKILFIVSSLSEAGDITKDKARQIFQTCQSASSHINKDNDKTTDQQVISKGPKVEDTQSGEKVLEEKTTDDFDIIKNPTYASNVYTSNEKNTEKLEHGDSVKAKPITNIEKQVDTSSEGCHKNLSDSKSVQKKSKFFVFSTIILSVACIVLLALYSDMITAQNTSNDNIVDKQNDRYAIDAYKEMSDFVYKANGYDDFYSSQSVVLLHPGDQGGAYVTCVNDCSLTYQPDNGIIDVTAPESFEQSCKFTISGNAEGTSHITITDTLSNKQLQILVIVVK